MLIYLCDQILSSNLGAGIGAALAIASFGIYKYRHRTAYPYPLPGNVSAGVFLAGFLLYQVLSLINAPADCDAGGKYFFSVILFFTLLWSSRWMSPEAAIFNWKSTRILLWSVVVTLLLGRIGFDLMTVAGHEPRIPTGFFSEPSHMALYVMPLIFYRLFWNIKDKLAWSVATLILLLASSTTLFVGMFLFLFTRFFLGVQGKLLAWIVPAVVGGSFLLFIFVLAPLFEEIPLFARVIGLLNSSSDGIVNMSSAVWLNGWSQAYAHFEATSGLGVGFTQMGCGNLATSGHLSPLLALSSPDGLVVNSKDGSFLLSKIVSEFGLVGLAVCAYLSKVAFTNLRNLATLYKGAINVAPRVFNDMVWRATGALTILSYLYVRGLSYFNIPVLMAFYLLRPRKNQN